MSCISSSVILRLCSIAVVEGSTSAAQPWCSSIRCRSPSAHPITSFQFPLIVELGEHDDLSRTHIRRRSGTDEDVVDVETDDAESSVLNFAHLVEHSGRNPRSSNRVHRPPFQVRAARSNPADVQPADSTVGCVVSQIFTPPRTWPPSPRSDRPSTMAATAEPRLSGGSWPGTPREREAFRWFFSVETHRLAAI